MILHLPAHGEELTVLTQEQADYMCRGVKVLSRVGTTAIWTRCGRACSFTNQVLAQLVLLRYWKVTTAYKNGVYLLKKHLDEQVAYWDGVLGTLCWVSSWWLSCLPPPCCVQH